MQYALAGAARQSSLYRIRSSGRKSCLRGRASRKLGASKLRTGGIMRFHFTKAAKILGGVLAALCLFAGGYVAGQAKFGQPKTVLHVVELKWRPGVPQMEKDAAMAGIQDMAAKMPGIKNIWIKWDRLEPRDFSAAFAIEFRSREA